VCGCGVFCVGVQNVRVGSCEGVHDHVVACAMCVSESVRMYAFVYFCVCRRCVCCVAVQDVCIWGCNDQSDDV